MGQSLTCVRRLQAVLDHVLSTVLTYAQGIEEGTKRHRSNAFLYRRTVDVDLERAPPQPSEVRKPVIHVSRPGDENAPLERVKAASAAATAAAAAVTAANGAKEQQRTVGGESAAGDSVVAVPPKAALPERPLKAPLGGEHRRFHLARSSTPLAMPTPLGRMNVDKRSRYSSPALFVERSKRRKVSARALEKHVPESMTDRHHRHPDSKAQSESDHQPKAVDSNKNNETHLPKRPGSVKRPLPASASTTSVSGTGGGSAVPLPPSLLGQQDVDMDQLAREMHEYTMQTISRNISRIESESKQEAASAAIAGARMQTAAATAARQQSAKLKPKAPAKRLAERHPETTQTGQQTAAAAGTEQQETDAGMDSDTDDDDYVVETYVRVPGDNLTEAIPPEKVGLLVFDTEPDVEFFYGDETDTEPELEDEEDENGTFPAAI